MRYRKAVLTLLPLLAVAGMAHGAHTSARLLLSAHAVRPGETVIAGVELKMEPGWHTYWRNSGASGMPTTIDWALPPGMQAGEIQWPLGDKLPEGELTTYVYSNRVILLTPIQIGPDVPQGKVELKAKVSWLECEKLCLPGDADLRADLEIGAGSKPSPEAPELAEWMKKVPTPNSAAAAQAAWRDAGGEAGRTLRITWKPAHADSDLKSADFYPYSSDTFEILPDTRIVEIGQSKIAIEKQVKKLGDEWPDKIGGVLVEVGSAKQQGIEVLLSPSLPSLAGGGSDAKLWLMLLYAFVGGLILNIMPCVLPVISLKILGFVNSAKDSPARVRNLGLIYAAGVVCSFLVLAAVVIGLKLAGQSAGWGMQFGNPWFVMALGILITLVALNLFGLFEVNPGGKVLDTAGSLASKHGSAGAFFNGVLATVLATPCTAPFLGAALGFAFLQPAPYVVLIFVVVALGLAAPYVLLSWNPRLLKFLPKPGRWMEWFKVAMGFPMLATAVWIASLLPAHYGARAWWFVMFLVVIALCAWIYGQFIQRESSRRGLAWAALLLLLAAGYWAVLEKQLQWRSPIDAQAANPSSNSKPDGIAWKTWSPDAVAQARNEGKPVLVDFTADWCLTCQANKKFAIEVPEVKARLEQIGAVALLGDYTRLPADITRELNRHGRAGVPLVLVYPAEASLPPIVLPEALTPGIVLDALDRATRAGT